MFGQSESNGRYIDCVRIGEVSSIDPVKCTARVVFDDEESMVSYDLPVLQRNTMGNRDYQMPEVGEDVVCLFRSGGCEDGFIIGSFYAGQVTPPETSPDKRTVVFRDDTKVSYDRASHKLSVQIDGTTIVADRQSVVVETPKAASVKSGQTVDIEAAQAVNVNAGAVVNIASPVLTLTMGGTKMTLRDGTAEITSSSLTFKGSMNVTGSLSVDGNITSSGSIHGTNI